MGAKRLTQVLADFVARVKLKSPAVIAAVAGFFAELAKRPTISLKDFAKLALLPAVNDANLDRPVDALLEGIANELEARGMKWFGSAMPGVITTFIVEPLTPPPVSIEDRVALLERAAAREVSAPTPPPAPPAE